MSSHQTLTTPQKVNGSTEELFVKTYQTKDPIIRKELILQHRDLVRRLASRFTNRGRPLDSLISVGTIGLIKAIDRYDVSRRVKFTTYATHCILGEIKRYFRDKTWGLKVPRSLKKLNSIIHDTIENLTTKLGRCPTIPEIAQKLDITSETVIEAIEAGRSYNPCSLEQKLEFNDEGSFCFLDSLNQADQKFRNLVDKIDLKIAIGTLSKRERMIIQLFYFEGYSQAEIAQRLGISQMHVSRLLRGTLKSLKKTLGH